MINGRTIYNAGVLTPEEHKGFEKCFRIYMDILDKHLQQGHISNWLQSEITGAFTSSTSRLQDRTHPRYRDLQYVSKVRMLGTSAAGDHPVQFRCVSSLRKEAASPERKVKFLGFSFYEKKGETRVRIHPKSVA